MTTGVMTRERLTKELVDICECLPLHILRWVFDFAVKMALVTNKGKSDGRHD